MVDFAEPGAPHTERVITLHSLLDVDAYRPSGLVTPPPPRRRRWRRRPPKPIVKEASWIVPVSDNPERRIAVIANQWRAGGCVQAADRRAARLGGGRRPRRHAGRRPDSWPSGSRRCSPSRGSCSCSHARPRTNTASCGWPRSATCPPSGPARPPSPWPAGWSRRRPTWQQDRGQGARVLLLAMGDGKIEAPIDRIVAWTWQLARAARDHEYRYAGSHVTDGRSLLGALAAASDEQDRHRGGRAAGHRRHHLTARSRRRHPRRRLAAPKQRRRTAGREARGWRCLSDPHRLAAALGSNIPAPQPKAKQAKRAKAKEKSDKGETVSFNGAVVGATPPAVPVRRGGRPRADRDPGRRSRCGCATTPTWWSVPR